MLQIQHLEGRFESWQRMVPGTLEQDGEGNDLDAKCTSIIWQVDELDHAINTAAQDPPRYGLTDGDIASRRSRTGSARTKLLSIQKVIQDSRGRDPRGGGYAQRNTHTIQGWGAREIQQSGNHQHQHHRAFQSSGLPSKGGPRTTASNHNSAWDDEHQMQTMMMREQDQHLDLMSEHVQRIGEIGLVIGQELGEQGQMLDELSEDVDTVRSRLKAAQRKIGDVMKKTSARGQCCMIMILATLLMILTMLVFG